MNLDLLKKAQERIPCVPVLVNLISKRVKELNAHKGSYVKHDFNAEPVDIALQEVAEGKLIAEFEDKEEGNEAEKSVWSL